MRVDGIRRGVLCVRERRALLRLVGSLPSPGLTSLAVVGSVVCEVDWGISTVAFTAGAFQRHAQDEAGKFTLTPWFNKIASADILFLDDLGKGYWTENTEAIWFDLLEHRTSQGKPVIVTTNYTGDELINASRSEATAYAIRRLRDYCETIVLD
jgi:DNA replication protein DnaC